MVISTRGLLVVIALSYVRPEKMTRGKSLTCENVKLYSDITYNKFPSLTPTTCFSLCPRYLPRRRDRRSSMTGENLGLFL